MSEGGKREVRKETIRKDVRTGRWEGEGGLVGLREREMRGVPTGIHSHTHTFIHIQADRCVHHTDAHTNTCSHACTH